MISAALHPAVPCLEPATPTAGEKLFPDNDQKTENYLYQEIKDGTTLPHRPEVKGSCPPMPCSPDMLTEQHFGTQLREYADRKAMERCQLGKAMELAACGRFVLTKRNPDRNVSADDAGILPRAFCVQGNVL